MKPEKEIDHVNTDEAICPYCGHEHDASHEFFGRGHTDSAEVECVECGKEFFLERDFAVYYTSSKKK